MFIGWIAREHQYRGVPDRPTVILFNSLIARIDSEHNAVGAHLTGEAWVYGFYCQAAMIL
jgi:hypothetical protein